VAVAKKVVDDKTAAMKVADDTAVAKKARMT
jgi:hypothetical protein